MAVPPRVMASALSKLCFLTCVCSIQGKAQERIPVLHRDATGTLMGTVVKLKHMLGMAATRCEGAAYSYGYATRLLWAL